MITCNVLSNTDKKLRKDGLLEEGTRIIPKGKLKEFEERIAFYTDYAKKNRETDLGPLYTVKSTTIERSRKKATRFIDRAFPNLEAFRSIQKHNDLNALPTPTTEPEKIIYRLIEEDVINGEGQIIDRTKYNEVKDKIEQEYRLKNIDGEIISEENNEIIINDEVFREDNNVSEVKEGVEEVFNENPELANAVYEALGFNQELAFVKSDNTIDDDFYIKDELIVTEELQNIRTTNWDGSINIELSNLKNKLNQLPIGSKFNISEYTKPTITSLEKVLNSVNLSESNRILLEKIKPLIENVKIEYVDKFILSDSGAVYSDKYNTIRLNRSEKSIPLEELLMHELLHAATFRKISYFETNTKGLSKKELAALNELENIRKVLKEASDKYWDNRPRFARSVNPLEGYRTDSIHEIISYAFTNKEFRNAIATIPYKENKSILDKLIELIANIFNVKQDTVLNALLANAEVLLENNKVTPQQKQQATFMFSDFLDAYLQDFNQVEKILKEEKIIDKKCS